MSNPNAPAKVCPRRFFYCFFLGFWVEYDNKEIGKSIIVRDPETSSG